RLDVGACHVDSVFEAQKILEENLQGVGKTRHLFGRQSGHAPDFIRAIAYFERRTRFEAVRHGSSAILGARIIIRLSEIACGNFTGHSSAPADSSSSRNGSRQFRS